VASRSVDAILAANRALTRNGDGLIAFVATSNSGSSSSGNISSVSSGNSSSGNDEGGEKASRDRDESEVIFTHALLLGDYTCLFLDPFLPLSTFLFLSSFSSSFSSLETPVSYPLFMRLWSLCVSCCLGVGPCLFQVDWFGAPFAGGCLSSTAVVEATAEATAEAMAEATAEATAEASAPSGKSPRVALGRAAAWPGCGAAVAAADDWLRVAWGDGGTAVALVLLAAVG
jgi:hypothetical protein